MFSESQPWNPVCDLRRMSKSVGVASWETTDFPNVCEKCLGNNPFLRMTKEHYGRDCKVCLKPFTLFRWCPGHRLKFRRTEICATCSKLKNLCQSCMLDLQYGLPAQVRDTVLGVTENVPKNEANREFFIATNKSRLERGDSSLVDYEKAGTAQAKALLERLARKAPNNDDRNLAPPCSFYAKGRCTRGDTCPYRHALVAERYPSLQSYRNRYYGENDPAAKQIIEDNTQIIDVAATSKSKKKGLKLTANQLMIGGMDEDELSTDDIKAFFTAKSFLVKDIQTLDTHSDGDALVSFEDDVDVGAVILALGDTIEVKGVELDIFLPDSFQNKRLKSSEETVE